MDNWPNLAILLMSYSRPKEAIRTIAGISKNLVYDGKLKWYVADDGSDVDKYDAIMKSITDYQQALLGCHNRRFSPRTGLGWNQGLGICYQDTDYVLVMEDDWELNTPLNINPFVEMLSQREDVGLVRLGGLAVGSTVEIVGHNGHHYLNYLKGWQYAYSGNPHIRHARFVRAYGWYAETELNPGELELSYDGHFRATPGPAIWRPADIPGWGVFGHIGETRYR